MDPVVVLLRKSEKRQARGEKTKKRENRKQKTEKERERDIVVR